MLTGGHVDRWTGGQVVIVSSTTEITKLITLSQTIHCTVQNSLGLKLVLIKRKHKGYVHREAWFPGGPRIPKNPIFFKNGKNHPKRKNSKTSTDMSKLAIRPSTRGL